MDICGKKTTTKKYFVIVLLCIFTLQLTLAYLPTVKAADSYSYSLNGPVDEATAITLTGNIVATAHFASGAGADEIFSYNGAYIYNSSSPVRYFSFSWNNSGEIQTREYWLSTTEQASNITSPHWVAFTNVSANALTSYIISFMDHTGLLKAYPYVEIRHIVLNSYYVVERRPVDVQNIIVANLHANDRYQIVFTDGTTYKTYGDLTTTSTTGIQLVIRGVDFPKETLLQYQYVHSYAYRDFLTPTGAITVNFEDITNSTNSVEVVITEIGKAQYNYTADSEPHYIFWRYVTNNTEVFNQTFTGALNQTFSYTWPSADNATDYKVTVTIDHADFGSFYFKQTLIGEYTKPSNPLDLSFAGTIPVATAYFIPALLIIFVAGCFSELSSEIACVLTCIVAIILTAIGLIPITSSAIVVALSLSLLAGIITVRRKFY